MTYGPGWKGSLIRERSVRALWWGPVTRIHLLGMEQLQIISTGSIRQTWTDSLKGNDNFEWSSLKVFLRKSFFFFIFISHIILLKYSYIRTHTIQGFVWWSVRLALEFVTRKGNKMNAGDMLVWKLYSGSVGTVRWHKGFCCPARYTLDSDPD